MVTYYACNEITILEAIFFVEIFELFEAFFVLRQVKTADFSTEIRMENKRVICASNQFGVNVLGSMAKGD